MELGPKTIRKGSKDCMRDRPDCPALLFCVARVNTNDANLTAMTATFFKCDECSRIMVEYSPDSSGHRCFIWEIHKDCPLRFYQEETIDTCLACLNAHAVVFDSELGAPSDKDDDNYTGEDND